MWCVIKLTTLNKNSSKLTIWSYLKTYGSFTSRRNPLLIWKLENMLHWMSWQSVNRAKTRQKNVAVQRLKILNYRVPSSPGLHSGNLCKVQSSEEAELLLSGCVSITFHYRGSEEEACWRLLTSYRVEHKISGCVGRIKATGKHSSPGRRLLPQLSSNSSCHLIYRINLE